MSTLATLDAQTVDAIWDTIGEPVCASKTLQEAAEHLITGIRAELNESTALARAFVTVPRAELPEFHRSFVDTLAADKGLEADMNDNTAILSLLSTHGDESAWDSVTTSQGHVGIPLASQDFVDAVPMLSRLLQEFKVGKGLVSGDLVLNSEESAMRTFYVPDAAESVDATGRKIIPAQDFVASYGVKSVFGIGGPYWEGSQHVLACIFFCKEELDPQVLETLMSLFKRFKGATGQLVEQKAIFA